MAETSDNRQSLADLAALTGAPAPVIADAPAAPRRADGDREGHEHRGASNVYSRRLS